MLAPALTETGKIFGKYDLCGRPLGSMRRPAAGTCPAMGSRPEPKPLQCARLNPQTRVVSLLTRADRPILPMPHGSRIMHREFGGRVRARSIRCVCDSRAYDHCLGTQGEGLNAATIHAASRDWTQIAVGSRERAERLQMALNTVLSSL